MGMMVVEQQQQQQSAALRTEDSVDKKKKRRSRRSKQNSSLNGSASMEVAGQHQQELQNFQNGNTSRNGSSSKQHGPNKTTNVSFNSLPTMHINDQGAKFGYGMKVYSKSCPIPGMYGESSGLDDDGDFFPPYLEGCNKQKRFDPHWSLDAIKEALERGEVFQATLRVNAHNRLEAYCTIEGVPADVLISGIPLQNRAVEGDVVAVKVDPPFLWSRMKGSAGSANNSSPTDDQDPFDDIGIRSDSSKGKDKMAAEPGRLTVADSSAVCENGFYDMGSTLSDGTVCQEVTGKMNSIHVNGHHHSGIDPLHGNWSCTEKIVMGSVEKLCQAVVSFPSKRPTGRVVAILEPSARRSSVVGFLNIRWWLSSGESFRKENRNMNAESLFSSDYIHLAPTDPKFPKMIVPVESLPTDIKKRLDAGDVSIENELVAARIDCWTEESSMPQACVMHSFGRGGEVEPRIASILFENAICSSEFSPDSLSCLPDELWQVPQRELECRKDIRDLCVFTIDPSTATDLDDALSVEKLSSGVYRVGVHIADVSYFVRPDTALDVEARVRSTSIYMLQRKLPMLPPLLSEKLGSLNPGVERLAFSIFWDVSVSGDVLDRWVGRTVIRSCCKLSCEHAQDIIEDRIDVDGLKSDENNFPQLYGNFNWRDIFQSVRILHDISKTLKEKRFNDGALRLENAKVVFLLDESGVPYDSVLCERKESNFLVEEFMLLANRTAAEIISRAYPERALLRRHPEPNRRKLRELEAFCSKHELELDTTTSGSFHRSLEKIKEKLKDDSVLYDILMNYATKPMQVAKYFCSGDLTVGEDDWGHYALAVPLYTHFTSPLRRYPDIVVHRTLTAALEAEQAYLKRQRKVNKDMKGGNARCFTGMHFDKFAAESVEGQRALASAALMQRLPGTEVLSDVASYCNQKKVASRNVKDAVEKLYMWVLLKSKQILFSEARVLGIGPRFISLYVQKLAVHFV
uniref:DIS3-like exonuclease 2 n=1 Tax=Opuntia streptacantha TaxID=393608 RepID=A0A7C9EB15_OPUST